MFSEWLIRGLGPWLQFFITCGFTLLFCGLIAAAFWTERGLMKYGFLGRLPVSMLVYGIFYGALRFSGRLLYASDGWNTSSGFNYTNQAGGALFLAVFGSLFIGSLLALRREW